MDFLQYFYLLASTWPWFFGQQLLVQTDDDVVSNGLQLIWCTITTGIIIHSTCSGQPEFASFPRIPFKDFSDFILENFGPTISLPTVITVLLSMTNNTELLSLHFKQSKNGVQEWRINYLDKVFGLCN